MNDKIYNMIKDIDKTNVFYKEKWNKYNIDTLQSLDELPLVYKDDVLLNENKMLNNKYLENNKYNICSERTSGSTGKCLMISWEKSDYVDSHMELFMRRKKWYNIKTLDKFCYFYTTRMSNEKYYSEKYKNGLGFSKLDLNEDRCMDIIDSMNEYNPRWILTQPSIAYILSRVIFETGINPPKTISYIELTGEMLTNSTKRFIENAFNAKVANQYGTYEVNSISYECPYGNMHIMSNNVEVEIVDNTGKALPKGEEGLIAVTSKKNRVMPFVRYIVGDYGIITNSKCQCGCNDNNLIITRGRDNDYIITSNGDYISVYEFVNVFNVIETVSEISVYQYQITQEDIKKFNIYVVMQGNREWFEYLFYSNIQSKELRESEYKIIYLEKLIPDANTGKLRMFKRNIII